MNFLVYIEHAAENLQFFLWHHDYTNRFNELPKHDQALSPEWTAKQAEAEALAAQNPTPSEKKISPEIAAALKGTDFDPKAKLHPGDGAPNPFETPPRTPNGEGRDSMAPSTVGWSEESSTLRNGTNYNKAAAAAFESAKQFQPYTIQPYREEISRIIAIYIAKGGSRELNISSKQRQALLRALATTTHPSAFGDVVGTVEWSLRHQAHPNFIRWTICNGNRPRVLFARTLGISCIVGGIVCALILTLSSVGRGWRALSAILVFLGVSTLIAAWKGMCIVLHGMHHRHLRPWELFTDEDDLSTSNYEMKKDSFDTLGSKNSFEDEPWIAKYEKRNFIRKIFDREVWIQEPALRQIQDTIFLQAITGALLVAGIIAAIFVAVPKGGFF